MGSGPTQTTKQQTTSDQTQNAIGSGTTGVQGTNLNQSQTSGYNNGVQQGSQTGVTGTAQYGGTNAWSPTLPGMLQVAGQGAQIAQNAPLSDAERYAIGGLQGTANYNAGLNPMFTGAASYMLDPNNLSKSNDFVMNAGNTAQYLTPMARGDFVNTNNPALQGMLDQIKTDVTKSVGDTFAAAGRPLGSNGAGTYALGRGMSAGLAQPMMDWYNQRSSDQIAANAGLTAASLGIGNFLQNNVGNAASALSATYAPYNTMLAGSQYGRTAPLTTLSGVNSMLLPAAQAFGQTYGMGSGYTGQNTTGVNQAFNTGTNENLLQNAMLTQLANKQNTTSHGEQQGTSTTKTSADPFSTALGIGSMLLGAI